MDVYTPDFLRGSGLQVAIRTEQNQIEHTPALAFHGRLCPLLDLIVGCQN